MEGKRNSVLLDVDTAAFEKKLLLSEDMNEELDSLFPLMETRKEAKDDIPWKWVEPLQGLCVKTHQTDGSKAFVNICHTEHIPAPHNLDEESLLKLYASLDTEEEVPDTGIRIPMSIGEAHEETDKSGFPCVVYDVAINSSFLQDARRSKIVTRFLMQVTLEAIQDKFKIQIDLENYTILKNRQVMGKLRKHRVQQRQVRGPLIQDLGPASSRADSKAISEDRVRRPPDSHKLTRRVGPDGRAWLQAEVAMSDVVAAGDIALRAGEDRLVVESARRGYLLDVFLPLRLDPDGAKAFFVKDGRVLKVLAPIATA